jgi:hypothetical protein
MRNSFAKWKILLALVAAILLAILTFRTDEADAAPPLAERLRQHTQAIASGAHPHHAEATFAAHGYHVRRHHYGVGTASVSTIEASLDNVAPGARPERVFIVGSRYDAARRSPDDDGAAAGAAAVLEVARLLKYLRPAAGTEIRFVLLTVPQPHAIDAVDQYSPDSTAPSAPRVGDASNFIAFVGTRAASGPVRQALAAFREDADFLAAGIAAPCYLQAVTLTTHPPAGAGGAAALLVTDTAFMRYPYFRTVQEDPESEHDNMARVVTGLARTLAALAGAPSI